MKQTLTNLATYLLALAGLALYATVAGPVLMHLPFVGTTALFSWEWVISTWQAFKLIPWPPQNGMVALSAALPFWRVFNTDLILHQRVSYSLMSISLIGMCLSYPPTNTLLQIVAVLIFIVAWFLAYLAEQRDDLHNLPRRRPLLKRQCLEGSLVWIVLAMLLPLMSLVLPWWGWLGNALVVGVIGFMLFSLQLPSSQPATSSSPSSSSPSSSSPANPASPTLEEESKQIKRELKSLRAQLDDLAEKRRRAEHVAAGRRATGQPSDEFARQIEELQRLYEETERRMAQLQARQAQLKAP